MIAEKNDPLLGPASDQTRMEEILNTGSRKHDVSKLHFVLSPARLSRGQVYRDFINSPLSVANRMPETPGGKSVILRGPSRAFPAALCGCATMGVAW